MTEQSFTVFPAIDLRDGKVVRLEQGDPNRQTVYSDDPAAFAQKWRLAGADWVHIINLSGAFGEDEAANMDALKTIVSSGLKVEFGGGVRSLETIEKLALLGVQRVFLGTIAIQQPQLLKQAVSVLGDQMIAGDIGAKDGKVVIKGWQESLPLSVADAGKLFVDAGVRWCVLTDVSRDGIGRGVNIDSAIGLQNQTGLRVVASGGVASIEEVKEARLAGLAGIIIGRALYTGQINLKDCLAV